MSKLTYNGQQDHVPFATMANQRMPTGNATAKAANAPVMMNRALYSDLRPNHDINLTMIKMDGISMTAMSEKLAYGLRVSEIEADKKVSVK